MTELKTGYKVVVQEVGEDYWEIFKKIAELIIERMINSGGLTIERVIRECFFVVHKYAMDKLKPIVVVLDDFDGLNYNSIPLFIREWFSVYTPTVGTRICNECEGFQ